MGFILSEEAKTKSKDLNISCYFTVIMNTPTFQFPDKEVSNYNIHGIAHARLNQIIPIPVSGCNIDLEPLLEIEQPRFYWVKEKSDAPEVIIASSKAHEIPESAFSFDSTKKLDFLVVKYSHDHPKKEYINIELEPNYKN